MFPSSFWKLVHILWLFMARDTAGSDWQGSALNGVIRTSQQLSMGLHFFAGEVFMILLAIMVSVSERFIKVCMWSLMPSIPVNSLTLYFPRVKKNSRKLLMDS